MSTSFLMQKNEVKCNKCNDMNEWYKKMIQCWKCLSWYHDTCLEIPHPNFIYGDRFWRYRCKKCQGEELIKMDLDWKDIVQLSLFNLWYETNNRHHDISDVIEFVKKNWSRFECERIKNCDPASFHGRFTEVFSSNSDIYTNGKELKKKSTMWGLKLFRPPKIEAQSLNRATSISDLKRKCMEEDELRGTGAVVSSKFLELQKKKKTDQKPAPTVNVSDLYQHLPTPPPEPLNCSFDYTRKKRGRKPKEYYEQMNNIEATTNICTASTSSSVPSENKHKFKTVDARMKGKCISTTNVVDKTEIDSFCKQKLTSKKLENSIANIFGPLDRLKNGQDYTVHAKRINADNQVEYLIEWHYDQ